MHPWLLLAALVSAEAAPEPVAAVGPGQLAPAFVLPLVGEPGRHFVSREVVGPWAGADARPLTLLFVASWVEARGAAAEALEGIEGEVLVVVSDSHPQLVATATTALPRGTRVVHDAHRVLTRRFGARALPLVVAIQADGRVGQVWAGADAETLAAVRAALAAPRTRP